MNIRIGAILLLALTGTAQAVPIHAGDVFTSVENGAVQHWRPGTGLLATYYSRQGGFTAGMAFDAADNLYVTNFTAANISKFDNNGNSLGVWATNDASSSNESILFDASGNAYIGQADGTRDIIKRAADGTFIARYNVTFEGRGSDWIDLAADQSTMYYTSEGRSILRYDVAADTQLADFALLTGLGTAFALRLLDDEGLLVADRGNIKRLNAAGMLMQTYDVDGHNNWFSLDLDPDKTTFWSGDFGTGQFHQFNIANGALLNSFDTGTRQMLRFGLTVFGGGIVMPDPDTDGVSDD